ncbi:MULTISPECIES: CBS domain-containing protein [unclassified Streptomyces]|uniref:CBS domain-containing protein n=1 Tax=unclassified Streptomyces TaxID=2593676 RepID=UPI00278BDD4B|nr:MULTISPECIES: CBS domain-containing protein [unclassified Streptomyces]
MKHVKTGAVMVTDVVTVRGGTPFKEVARLLAERRISGLPVVDDDGHVVGVISETDLLRHQAEQLEPYEEPGGVRGRLLRMRPGHRRAARRAVARTADGLMSSPARTVRAEATLAQAARTMAEHGVERLPVVDEEDRLVGIVTRRDLLGVFLVPDAEIRRTVIEEVLVRALWLTPRSVAVDVREGVVTLDGQLERRSERDIARAMTRRADGVVGVVDRLTFRVDDSHLRPDEQALHGVADDWLRKL